MPNRSIDPATLTFAQSLVRIKARQLAKIIPSPAVNNRKDLEQDLLLEVVVRWSRFNPSRGSAEAFVERVVERYSPRRRPHLGQAHGHRRSVNAGGIGLTLGPRARPRRQEDRAESDHRG